MGPIGIQLNVVINSNKNLKMNYTAPNDLSCNMCGRFELTTDNEKNETFPLLYV